MTEQQVLQAQIEELMRQNKQQRREIAVELIRLNESSGNVHISGSPFARGMVWFVGSDNEVGTSSMTMLAFALGIPRLLMGREAAPPRDPSDFGRCYRLLQVVPEVREHFDVITRYVPGFAGIIDHWDELCALWEKESPTGRCPLLYKRIQELRGEK